MLKIWRDGVTHAPSRRRALSPTSIAADHWFDCKAEDNAETTTQAGIITFETGRLAMLSKAVMPMRRMALVRMLGLMIMLTSVIIIANATRGRQWLQTRTLQPLKARIASNPISSKQHWRASIWRTTTK